MPRAQVACRSGSVPDPQRSRTTRAARGRRHGARGAIGLTGGGRGSSPRERARCRLTTAWRSAARPRRRAGRGFERWAGSREVGVAALGRPAGLEMDRGERHRDRRLALDELVGQAREQRPQRGAAPGQHDVEPALTGEVGREAPLLGGDGVADRLDRPVVAGVPARRARVQFLALATRARSEAAAQELQQAGGGSDTSAAAVERDDEAVAPLELGERLGAALLAEHRVGELAAHLVDGRRAHEEVAEIRRAGPRAPRSRGSRRRRGRRRRNRARPGSGRRSRAARATASASAPAQPSVRVTSESTSGAREHHTVTRQQQLRLLAREGERSRAQLGELRGEAQAVQRQRRVAPRRHHQAEARRCDLQQLGDAGEHALVGDLLEVVEHEHDGLVAVADRPVEQRRSAHREPAEASGGASRARGIERDEHALPEALGRVVLARRASARPCARGAAPASIHELSSVVLPDPGGAATSVSLRLSTAAERLSKQPRARHDPAPPHTQRLELRSRDAVPVAAWRERQPSDRRRIGGGSPFGHRGSRSSLAPALTLRVTLARSGAPPSHPTRVTAASSLGPSMSGRPGRGARAAPWLLAARRDWRAAASARPRPRRRPQRAAGRSTRRSATRPRRT